MKVLSLFDGISTGRLALERAGILVEKYYSSEIDKYAMQVSAKNYPDIVRLGDCTKIDFTQYAGEVDLVIGGSPCQGFSFAGKQLNFDDPRSKLFFEFVRAVREIKPKYFLLENVKMKKEFQDVISEQLGVKPFEINSTLVSAQNRRRLYWTNIPVNSIPEDKHIMLKDIVHENTLCDRDKSLCVTARVGGGFTAERYLNKHIHQGVIDKQNEYVVLCAPEATKKGFAEISVDDGIDLTFIQSKTRRGRKMEDKCNCLTASKYDYGILESLKKYIVPFDQTLKILEKEVEKGKIGYFRKDSQANRVYFIHDKAVCLCGDAGGGAAKMGQYLFGCITPDRVEKRQKGQRFNDGQKFYTLTAQDKHGVLIEGYIRKLTPIECERLQTMPDDYTAGVSDSQRYKMLGNGWTADVIAHIFKGLK